MKCKYIGMIAARVVDLDGKRQCAILADRSDDASDVKSYGAYEIQHVKGAALLKVKDGKLTPIWQNDHAVAIREESGPVRVKIDQKIYTLSVDASGAIVQKPWVAPPVAPVFTPPLLADAPAGQCRRCLRRM
jgi:hypothetical protein